MTAKKVDLFIVGAAKSGTTSLVDFLSTVPGVFVPRMKEPFYFIDDDIGLSDESEYRSLYKKASESSVLVDASTGYLFCSNAAKRINRYNPNAKILIILRNPIDMSYSLWKYMRINGVENREFKEAFLNEGIPENYKGQGWSSNYLYRKRAAYFDQVKEYVDRFDDVKVFTFEDMILNQKKILSDVIEFLGLDYTGPLSLPKSNESGEPRWMFLKKLRDRRYPVLKKIISPEIRAYIRKVTRDINTKKTNVKRIPPNERVFYSKYFYDDVAKLKSIGVKTQFWEDF